MKKRSGFTVMGRLIGLVRPLTGYMLLAILMGLAGHLCASFITIFGGYAVLELLGFETRLTLTVVFACVIVFAVLRAGLRYGEQACNPVHFYRQFPSGIRYFSFGCVSYGRDTDAAYHFKIKRR